MFSKLLVRSSTRVLARQIAVARPASTAAAIFRPAAVSTAVRSFATAKAAPKPSSAPAPVPVKAAVSPVAKLQAVKTELATLLANEFNESGGAMDPNHPYAQYVKENGLEITLDKPNESIVIKKAAHGYNVTVKFSQSPDPDDNEMENEDENENENENEKEEESNPDDPNNSYSYSFQADVQAKDGGPVFRIFAVSSKDGKLYFEGMSTADKVEDVDQFPSLDYNDLPTQTQDKIADFMDLLKIDDEFAQFIPAVAAEMSRVSHFDQIQKMAAFLNQKN